MLRKILLLGLLLNAGLVFSQNSGMIVKPVIAPGNAILDPDGDGYVSKKTSGVQIGFVNNDIAESEIAYAPIVRPDPMGDPLAGPSCLYNEIVGTDAAGNNAVMTYFDGTNLLFRFRLGGYASNSKGYSLLIDTDQKFGFTGPNADPGAVPGNPGFEVEIVLETNFGVEVYNVAGLATTGSPVVPYSTNPYSTNCQKSLALTNACSDPDYFYDFYIPISQLTSIAGLGITTNTPLRMVAVTSMSPHPAIGNNAISDVGGVTTGNNLDDIYSNLINTSTPTTINTINTNGQLDRSACPSIGPVKSTDATVSVTTSETSGRIDVYIYLSDGTTQVGSTFYNFSSAGSWNVDISAITHNSGYKIKATVTATGKGVSYDNCDIETITDCGVKTSLTGVTVAQSNANKGVKVTVPNTTAAGTIIRLYYSNGNLVPNSVLSTSGGSAGSPNPATVSSGVYTYEFKCQSGNCFDAQVYIITLQKAAECESDYLYFCDYATGGTSLAPTITTSPITTSTTSISGNGTAASSIIKVYADGNQISSATSGGSSPYSWAATVSSLTLNQIITAKQIVSNQCLSPASSGVTVTRQAIAPAINYSGCSSTAPTSINGFSPEIGATVKLYKSTDLVNSIGSAIVQTGGFWNITTISPALVSGNIIKARIEAGGYLTASDYSSAVTISTKTDLSPYIINITTPTEGQTSVTGTISGGTYPITLKVYVDEALVGTGISLSSAGSWTVSGLNSFDLALGSKVQVTLTGTGCESALSTSYATVQCIAPADKTISSTTTTICSGLNGSITVQNSEFGIIYTPVLSDGTTVYGYSGTGNGGNLTLTTYALNSNTTLKVKAHKFPTTSCSSLLSGSINVTVNPTPAAPTASATQTYCGTGTTTLANLSVSVPSGSSVVWYNASTAGSTLPSSTNLVAGTTYYAQSQNSTSGCISSSRTAITVQSGTPAAPTAATNQNYCSGATVANLTASLSGPGTISWYAAASGGSALASSTALASGTTYYAETSHNSCVSSSRTAVTVTLYSSTTITGQSTATQTQCQGGTFSSISVTATGAGLTYQWYSNTSSSNTGGTLISGANTSSYTPSASTAGTLYYYCIVTGSCGSPVTSNVSGAFIVNDLPTAPTASATQTFCSSATVANLSATAPIGSSVNWYAVPSGSTPLVSTTVLVSGSTYYAESVDNSTLCVSSSRAAVTASISAINPSFSINDVSKSEGNSGSSNLSFTVSIGTSQCSNVSINYATSNGTATTANNDYTATSGTLIILAGNTSGTIDIPIIGDKKVEANETFTITLSSPSAGTILDATGIGTINNDDSSPLINDDIVSINENTANSTVVVNINDSNTGNDNDIDGDAINYSITAGNISGAFAMDPNTGAITVLDYTKLDYETTTSFTLTIQATDGPNSYSATITINLINVNEAPIITSNGGGATASISISENTTAVTTVTSTDVDLPAQTLTYSISGGIDAAKFSINSTTGTLVFLVAPNFEAPTDNGLNNVYDVQVKVTDSGIPNLTDVQDIAVTVINVNEAPVVSNFTKTGTEDNTVTFAAADFTSKYSDVENDALVSVKIVDLPANGTLKLSGANITAGQIITAANLANITFVPNSNWNGTTSFNWNANDGSLDAASNAAVTINLSAVNDMPSFTKGANQTVLEDAGAQTVTGWATAFDKGATDESGQTLTLTVTNNNNALFSVQPTINLATGNLAYTPAANANGTATVSIVLKDDGGTANGGVDTYTTQTFTITVTAVNDMPSFTKGANQTVLEDAGAQTVTGWATAFDKGATDESGQTLTLTVTNNNNALFSVQPTINLATGNLAYTPAANANGTATVSVVLKDDGGTANGGVDTYTTQTFTITVSPVNDAPVVSNITKNGAEDNAVTFAAADFTSKYSDIDNDALVSVKIVDLPANGTLKLSGVNIIAGQVITAANLANITFVPNSNWNGITSFNWNANDGNLDAASNALITINIASVNDLPATVNDLATTNEDSPITISVLGNDTGLGDGPISVSVSVSPTHGTITVNADNTITYTPNADFNGTDTFTYKVCDNDGECSTAVVTINVNSINDTPAAVNDVATTNEDGPVTVSVLGNDSGLGDTPVTVSVSVNPTHGTITVNADNTITYTPNADFNGTDTFTYKVCDGNGDCASATVTITVNSINDTPVAMADLISTNEDAPVTIAVLGNDTGLGDGPIVLNIDVNPTNGTVVVNTDNTITYTPNPNFNGTDTFTYKVCDNDGQCSTATVTITVNSINDTPVATVDLISTNEDAPATITVLGNDTGLGDGPVTVSVTVLPTNGTITVNADNTITYTPNADFNGTDTFTYKVCDGNGDCSTATVSITVNSINDIPAAVNDVANTNEDSPVTISVLINDTGLGDTPVAVSVTVNPTNGVITIKADNTITYTPNADFNGSDSFTYKVCDKDGECSTATVTITVNSVNDTPVATNDLTSTNENSPVTINVLGNDTSLGDKPVTVSVTINPTNGTFVINADNTVTYTPNHGYLGTDNFTYKVCDSNGDCAEGLVTVTVDNIDDIPAAVNDIANTDEDTPVTVNVLNNDTGLGDTPIAVTVTVNPTNGTVVVNPDNTITYTPNADFNGTDTFTYKVCDSNGDCATATVTITINSVNDIPAAVNDVANTNEDSPVTVSVLGNDTGLGDAPVSVSIIANPTNGTIIVNADNTVTYTPNADFNGTDVLTYKVCDKDGECSTATVTITINSVNDTPVAVNDNATTIVNTPITVSVLSNDNGLGDNPVAVSVTVNPANGTFVVNADNTITYTPNTGYTGTDTFTYKVCDSNGDCTTATVTITINSVNSTPVAVNDAATTDMNQAVTITVLSNDTGLNDTPVVVSVTVNPANGTFVVNADNTITYTPNTGYTGTDTFTYKVCDSNGDCATATVTITVNSVNSTPVAVNDAATTDMNQAVTITVLGNDTGLNDTPVVVSVTVNPAHGSFVVNADNTVTYTPSAGYTGTDTFTYKVCDSNGDCASATVTVTVNSTGIDHQPVAVDDNASTEKDKEVVISVLSNDTGLEDGGLVVSIINQPTHGTVLINVDNTVTYTPESGYAGEDSFTYQVCDADGDCSTAIANITIENSIIIPDGFSPNGDGINDNYVIPGLENYKRVSIDILNRWGSVVYSSSNYKNNWDGTANTGLLSGQVLPTGTYFYVLHIHDNGKKATGYVYLNK